MKQGFLITASLLLLFGLLLLTAQYRSSLQSQSSFSSSSLNSLSSLDAIASHISFNIKPFLPQISRKVDSDGTSTILIRDTLPSSPSSSHLQAFREYSSSLSTELGPRLNSAIWLEPNPTLSIGDSVSYLYDYGSEPALLITSLSSDAELELVVSLPDACTDCISGSWNETEQPINLKIVDSTGKNIPLPRGSGNSSYYLSLKTASSELAIQTKGTGIALLPYGSSLDTNGKKITTELRVTGAAARSPVFLDAHIKREGAQIDKIAVG